LLKRENYRRAFDNFDAAKIARYGDRDVARLLADAGIIRNRLKVQSAIVNARCFLAVQEEFGSFDRYIWQFTGGRTQVNRFRNLSDLPAHTVESDAMSKDMRGRGFKFVGTTICYAFMQAAGMVNDHLLSCFRYKAVMR
jgi:DNA-3-methyladenine glycosylase I